MNGEVVDGKPQNETDATGNGLHAVPTAVKGTCVLTEMARTTGPVGNARVNQSDATTYAQGLLVGNYSSFISDASKFTFSGWYSATSLGASGDYPRLVSAEEGAKNAFWSIVGAYSSGFGKIADVYSGGKSTVSTQTVGNFESPDWVYLTVVWNGTTVQVYANGKQIIEKTGITAQTALTSGFMIGGIKVADKNSIKRAWHGSYDEVRMYNGAMSEERAVADYATMNAPTEFLVYVSSVDSALWTGAADDGDGANTLNWECRDAKGDVMSGTLPTESTKILSCTLGANADWSQLGFAPFIPAGSVVELNGYTLTVSRLAGPGKVNNAAQGEAAQLVVSGSADWTNSDTVFDGNLKFVKTGAGTFESTIAQPYTGGTVVGAGTIQAPRSTEAYDATFTPFGTGTITIGQNGVLNVQSTVAYRNGVVLDGGTITGGVQMAGADNTSGRPVVMLERLTADSTITHSAKGLDIGVAGTPVDLGGYTLSVAIADATYFRFFGSLENTAGKIVTTGAGFLQELPALARGVDIDCSSYANLTLSGTEVHDYRAANGDRQSSAGTGRGVKVNGTYTPVGNYYYGCTMENGSTIDLSGRTGCFNVKSSLTEYNGTALTAAEKLARKTVQFEAGTVTVNLAGRTDLATIAASEDPYIVKWSTDTGMGEPSETAFVPDAATAHAYKFKKDSTGLMLSKQKGLMIIVQ